MFVDSFLKIVKLTIIVRTLCFHFYLLCKCSSSRILILLSNKRTLKWNKSAYENRIITGVIMKLQFHVVAAFQAKILGKKPKKNKNNYNCNEPQIQVQYLRKINFFRSLPSKVFMCTCYLSRLL